MEKPTAAIEICSKSIKLVIGYVIDGQVQVLYTVNKKTGHLLQGGRISNEDLVTLASEVKKLCCIEDSAAKLKINITEGVMGLPPFGLEVFQTKQMTQVVSESGNVQSTDIKNVYAMVRKCRLPLSTDLVDIIPTNYTLDKGDSYLMPPVGKASNSLQISAKIHSLPLHVIDDYRKVMELAGINVKKNVVSPQGAIEIIASYKDTPADYILVDIGSSTTTVSLVGNKELYASRFFMWGGDQITEKIVAKFNINEDEAEKYKILYGYDDRVMSFDAVICTSDDGEGNQIKHTVSHLNNIIKAELDVFASNLSSAITSLFESYKQVDYTKMPILLIGGGSLLYGLKEYLATKVPAERITCVAPRTLGARNPVYFNCLGMILMNKKYPNIYDDAHSKVNELSREGTKEN